MKQEKQIPQKKPRKTLVSLCAVSGLLLSIVCCIALVHVELRIQEHHRLLSHPTTFCDQIEEEILRKVQKNFKQWAAEIEKKSSRGKGKVSLSMYFRCFRKRRWLGWLLNVDLNRTFVMQNMRAEAKLSILPFFRERERYSMSMSGTR